MRVTSRFVPPVAALSVTVKFFFLNRPLGIGVILLFYKICPFCFPPVLNPNVSFVPPVFLPCSCRFSLQQVSPPSSVTLVLEGRFHHLLVSPWLIFILKKCKNVSSSQQSLMLFRQFIMWEIVMLIGLLKTLKGRIRMKYLQRCFAVVSTPCLLVV